MKLPKRGPMGSGFLRRYTRDAKRPRVQPKGDSRPHLSAQSDPPVVPGLRQKD